MAVSNELLIKIRALVDGAKNVKDLAADLLNAANAAISTGNAGKTAATGMDALGNASAKAAGGIEDAASSAQDAKTALIGLDAAAGALGTAMADAAADSKKAGDDIAEATGEAAEGLKNTAEGAEAAATPLGQLRELMTTLGANLSSLVPRLGDASARFLGLKDSALVALAPFNALFGAAVRLLGPLLALAGLKVSFDYLKDAADYAARTETLGLTLGIVARQAGYTDTEVSKFEKSLVKLGITTQSARDSMTQMMQAGIALGVQTGQTVPNVERLARAAQDLAVVSGQNSSDTFQKLITNIQQLDSMGLKYMGLMVNMEDAQNKFAQSLGVSASALTEAQKRQAALNEVMAQSAKFAGAYEASLESVGKKVQSLKRYQDELANSIGVSMLPAYGAIVDAVTLFLKNLEATVKANESFKESMASIAVGAGSLATGALDLLTEAIKFVMAIVAAVAPVLGGMAAALGATMQVASDILGVFTSLTGNMEILRVAGLALAFGFYGLADGISLVEFPVQGLLGAFALLTQGVSLLLANLFSYIPGFSKLSEGLRVVAEEAEKTADKATNRVRDLGKAFLDGDTYTQRFTSSVGLFGRSIEDLGKIQSFKALDADIRGLIRAQEDNTLTAMQVQEGYVKLGKSLESARDSGKLSEQQFIQLTQTLAGVKQKGLDEVNKALRDLKLTPGQLSKGISDEVSAAVSSLKVLAQGAEVTAQAFTAAFSEKISMAKTVQELQAFETAATAAFQSGKISADEYAEALGLVASALPKVLQGQLDTTKTQAQFAAVTETLKVMGREGTLSATAVGNALKDTDAAALAMQRTVASPVANQALKTLGLSATELATNLSEAGKTAVRAFNDIVDAGRATSEQLFQAFSKGLSMETSIQGLAKFQAAAQGAFEQGKLSVTAYQSALGQVSLKFDELLDKALATAKTKEEFRQLETQVKELGASGAISGAQVSAALSKIKEASTGARAEMVRLAQQQAEVAAGATKVAQAGLEITRAQLEVSKAKRAVLEAEKKVHEENTALSRAELAVAQANLKVSQEKAQLAVLQRNQEAAAQALLIAQQKLLNAEKEKEQNAGSAAAEAALQAAQKDVEAKQVALSTSEATVESQRQIVVTTEEAALKAEEFAEAMRSAAVGTKEIDRTVRNTAGEIVEIAAHTKDSVQQSLEGAGLMTSQAKAMVDELFRGQQIIAGFGFDGMAAFNKINDKVKEVTETIKASEEEAAKILENFDNVSMSIQDSNMGLDYLVKQAAMAGLGASAVAEAYLEIARNAAAAAKSAEDATLSFLNTTRGIHEELLSAQGRDEEAAASRFAARKQELAIQYELLKVQLQIARAQALAAGISTQGIDESISNAKAGFEQAKKDLNELEKMEKDKIRKNAEERKAQQEKEKQEDKKNLEGGSGGTTGSTGGSSGGIAAPAPGTAFNAFMGSLTGQAGQGLPAANPVQLTAQETGAGRPGMSRPEKVIQLDMTAGGKKVSATIPASQENSFLSMIETARGNAS